MSRLSASQIKGRSFKQDKPREGSRLREYYDRLLQGEAINFPGINDSNKRTILSQLKDYDLEISSIPDPTSHSPTRPRVLYKCVGIWVGDHLQSVADVEVAIENSVLRDNEGLV